MTVDLKLVEPPAPQPCACEVCRHLGARIYRERWLKRAEDLPLVGDVDAEITKRWHEYAPYQRELEASLPSRAVHLTYQAAEETHALRKLLAWWWENSSDRNIAVLAGPNGTGKTIAAVYLAIHELALEEPIFVTAHALARKLSEKTRNRTFKRALSGGVLIVDDLGKEASSAYFVRHFEEIVDRVYQSHKSLVVTTNLTTKQFRARYGESVADRLRERGEWIACNGKSMRGAK